MTRTLPACLASCAYSQSRDTIVNGCHLSYFSLEPWSPWFRTLASERYGSLGFRCLVALVFLGFGFPWAFEDIVTPLANTSAVRKKKEKTTYFSSPPKGFRFARRIQLDKLPGKWIPSRRRAFFGFRTEVSRVSREAEDGRGPRIPRILWTGVRCFVGLFVGKQS